MYRTTLATLWTGAGICLTLACLDASTGALTVWRGIATGGFVACAVCAVLQVWLHRLTDTVIANRNKSDEIRADVDQLRAKVDGLAGQVGEVRDLTEGHILVGGEHQSQPEPEPEPEPERDAAIFQFRLRHDGHDGIAGSRTSSEPTADQRAEIWRLLEEHDHETLPGTSSAS